MKISDMYLGKIDGYNEFLEYGQDTCKGLFFEFPNVSIPMLLEGSCYYIFGNKGTGKTMLLKYLESKVNENPEVNFTEYIRFKKNIDNEERNKIRRSAVQKEAYEEVLENEIPDDMTLDCILAWQVYLIKVIVNRLEETEFGVFDREDDKWEELKRLINALYGENTAGNRVKKILPKIKRGNVTLSLSKIGKTTLEFEWLNAEKTLVSFNYIAKQIVNLYSSLKPVDNNMYIFIDELELSLKKNKMYQRDVTLIRDLIFAIEYLNDINRSNKYNVYLIAAIRKEVYRHIVSKGMEINKTILDFGVTISWESQDGNPRNHPLMKMLEKRIRFSESLLGLPETEDVWEKYFTPMIGRGKLPIEKYILDQTWYKPRDIIRLFSIIKKRYGQQSFFHQWIFDSVRQTYSEESWVEFEEVLTATYSDVEVEGIKKVLTGLCLPFDLEDFNEAIEKKAQFFEEVSKLKENKKGPQILKDLYEIGVIGNYGENQPRFSFKGDVDVDPFLPMTIHYPLLRFFKATLPKRKRYK